LLWLYSFALSLSAALLFGVQPMIAKMILPYLGGTPAVWNTCLFFFQTFLLAGYAYAHCATRWIGTRHHALLHLGIMLAAVFFLPINLPVHALTHPDDLPVKTVFSALFLYAGLPFFVLSASSPLFQKWFAQTGHPAAKDPYFLYSASNLGSLLGLFAYPFLLEANFTVAEQSRIWLYGYLAFVALTFFCALSLRPVPSERIKDAACETTIGHDFEKPTLRRRVRWLILSFIPSSLLLGVSTYIANDVASVPFFWILPLALYLLSFAFAFGRSQWPSHPVIVRVQVFLLTAAAITFFAQATEPVWLLAPLHLAAFFATALVCHRQLQQDRLPKPLLTEFYLWISIAFLAPLLFNALREYPLAMVAAALAGPRRFGDSQPTRNWRWDVKIALGSGLIAAGLIEAFQTFANIPARLAHVIIFGFAGVICLRLARHPRRFGFGLAAMMLASSSYTGPYGKVLYSERSFFGVYRILSDRNKNQHLLFHSTTIHGIQSLETDRQLTPLSYYHPSGPAGEAFRMVSKTHARAPVAVIGLGAGSLACYGSSGQRFTFYEIDPVVERIARDQRFFSYLRNCPAATDVTIGDARVSLNHAPDHYYGIFVLDAFSSDAIPIHLLTHEALRLYVAKLAPDGVLLFHISNRYFDLAPVLARLAATMNLSALLREDLRLSEAEALAGKQPSRWVVMAPQSEVLAPLRGEPKWQHLNGDSAVDLWTDDHSNLLQALRWP
jgi:spermidine synthase